MQSERGHWRFAEGAEIGKFHEPSSHIERLVEWRFSPAGARCEGSAFRPQV
jgi:hypothetical protein